MRKGLFDDILSVEVVDVYIMEFGYFGVIIAFYICFSL